MSWNCKACGEPSEDGFDVCWNCGTGRDGSPPQPGFRADVEASRLAERQLECLRCTSPMAFAGRKRFHEGTQAWPFLLGEVGELLVNREAFDVYACPRCGKIEFFVQPAPGKAWP